MKLLRAALAASRSRAWSVAIGRSGLGCHCEKGEPVTARKANHNASNATVVTAGKMVCVSIKYRRPNRWTDQIWHAYADGPGDGSYLKKIDLPTQGGGRSGTFRGSKNQKSGKCHELPRKVIKQINPIPLPPGVGSFKGLTFQMSDIS